MNRYFSIYVQANLKVGNKKICVKNQKNRQFEISSDLLIPMRTAHKNWLLYRSEHVPLPQALIVVTGPAVLE